MSAVAKTAAKLAPLKQNVTKTSTGSEVYSYTSDLGPDTPILTLIHGYPQSAFEWRHVIPLLADKVSLFVPELPGYGTSTPCEKNDKKHIGSALLDAMSQVFQISSSKPRKIILGGHDRGARICHRLVVDKRDFPDLQVIGTVLLDIVPTLVQWESFANPRAAVAYFHWPLLANVDTSVKLIDAYGGGQWCRDAHTRIAGSSETGRQRLNSDGAVDVYAELFSKKETLRYSAEDYASGAAPEATEQTEDQHNGKQIEVPTLVMFSREKLGAMHDVENVWKNWIKPGVEYQGIGIGDGVGHYLPEEACDEVANAIKAFVDKVT